MSFFFMIFVALVASTFVMANVRFTAKSIKALIKYYKYKRLFNAPLNASKLGEKHRPGIATFDVLKFGEDDSLPLALKYMNQHIKKPVHNNIVLNKNHYFGTWYYKKRVLLLLRHSKSRKNIKKMTLSVAGMDEEFFPKDLTYFTSRLSRLETVSIYLYNYDGYTPYDMAHQLLKTMRSVKTLHLFNYKRDADINMYFKAALSRMPSLQSVEAYVPRYYGHIYRGPYSFITLPSIKTRIVSLDLSRVVLSGIESLMHIIGAPSTLKQVSLGVVPEKFNFQEPIDMNAIEIMRRNSFSSYKINESIETVRLVINFLDNTPDQVERVARPNIVYLVKFFEALANLVSVDIYVVVGSTTDADHRVWFVSDVILKEGGMGLFKKIVYYCGLREERVSFPI